MLCGRVKLSNNVIKGLCFHVLRLRSCRGRQTDTVALAAVECQYYLLARMIWDIRATDGAEGSLAPRPGSPAAVLDPWLVEGTFWPCTWRPVTSVFLSWVVLYE